MHKTPGKAKLFSIAKSEEFGVGSWEHGEGKEEEMDLRATGCKPKCIEGLEVKVNECNGPNGNFSE